MQNTSKQNINVAISGAMGKMGQEAIKAVLGQDNLNLTGTADISGKGDNAAAAANLSALGIPQLPDIEQLLGCVKADVLVDFTAPDAVMHNIHAALKHQVAPVVGTTGISEADLTKIKTWVEKYKTGAIIAPNFAIGAILLMKFSQLAARYFPQVEIIEMHHEHKIDAPSGTALQTTQLINKIKNRADDNPTHQRDNKTEKTTGARGEVCGGINIHSVRLPGLIARQDVIFGAPGQTLTISHNSIDRTSFMPGMIMAINHAPHNKGLIYGIENLIDLK